MDTKSIKSIKSIKSDADDSMDGGGRAKQDARAETRRHRGLRNKNNAWTTQETVKRWYVDDHKSFNAGAIAERKAGKNEK